MADRNYIQASPVLASYPEYKNTYIYLTFRVKNKYDWNGTGNVYLKYIGRKAGNVPIENNFIWDSNKKWCFHDTTKIIPMSNGTIDGQLFGNSNGITLTERLWDSTISDKYFSSDPNSPLYNRYYIFTPPTQGTSVQDEETYIIMRYETDNDGNVITLDTNGTATEMIRLSFEIPTGCDLQTVMLYDVRIHAKSKNASCSSVIYEDVLIDGNNNIKYVDNEVFTITSNVANGNGSITPYEGTKTFVKGSTAVYTFVPDSGYEVQYAIVDGVIKQGATSQGFMNIREDHSIIVYFVKQQQATYKCTANYVAYPSSDIIQPGVNPCPGLPYTKSDITLNGKFEVIPQTKTQYSFDQIIRKDNDGEREVFVTPVNGKYTFDNIISNTDITFRLRKVGPFTVSWNTTGGGVINNRNIGTESILAGNSFYADYLANSYKQLSSFSTNPSSYTPSTLPSNKSQGSIEISNVYDDISINAVFSDEPQPEYTNKWKMIFEVNIPDPNYIFNFNIYTYNYPKSTDLIDANYYNQGINNIIVDGNICQRAYISRLRNQYDNTLYSIQFITPGVYQLMFNFIPDNLTINGAYSELISKVWYNASEVTSRNKPILNLLSAENISEFNYEMINSDAIFNDNILLGINQSGIPTGINFKTGSIKEIGTDAKYNENSIYYWFRYKRLNMWGSSLYQPVLPTDVQILKGPVFENSKLPLWNIPASPEGLPNSLWFRKINYIEGPVFKNVSGVRDGIYLTPVESFVGQRYKSLTSSTPAVIKGWANGSTIYGCWEGIGSGDNRLRRIALNHSTYSIYCFHGLSLPTAAEIALDPVPSETQRNFNDSTTPYFKLLLNNTNISFDYSVLNDTTFETEKIILYLPQSVINREVVGNIWKNKNWALILPIETYGGAIIYLINNYDF